jgi:transposase
MSEPLSVDLRKRIVGAYERGGVTRQEVADLFQVGRATVNRLVKRYRTTGSLEPDPHGGGREPKFDKKGERVLRKLVEAHPDAMIPELVEFYFEKSGVVVGTSTMSRALARLGFTRKKSLWSRPSNPTSASKRYARVFEPGRAPWTLAVSSSSTRRDPISE